MGYRELRPVPPPALGSKLFEARDLGRRTTVVLLATALSVTAGLALVRFPVPVVIGLLVALAGTCVIFAYPFLGLLLYLLMFVLRPGETFPILETLHLERILGIVTLAALALAIVRRRGAIVLDSSPQTRALLIFIVAIMLSIPFSYWPRQSVETLITALMILSLYIMVVHLVDTPKRFRFVIWVYVFLVMYLDATSLMNYYGGSGKFAQGIYRASGATSAAGNANELGTTLACTFPLLLLLAFRETVLWRRILAGAFGLAAAWGMVLTGSRASFLGFVGGLVYLWWRSGRRRLLYGTIGMAMLLGGYFVIPDQYRGRYDTIAKYQEEGSAQSRLELWSIGLQMVRDRPILGVGAGCFTAANGANYGIWLNSHSLYIQVLAELGIVGTVAFFAFVAQFLRLNRRVARRLDELGPGWRVEQAVILGIFAGFMVLFVSGVFGHSLYRRTWYLYAGLGLALWRILQDPRFVPGISPLEPPKEQEAHSSAGR